MERLHRRQAPATAASSSSAPPQLLTAFEMASLKHSSSREPLLNSSASSSVHSDDDDGSLDGLQHGHGGTAAGTGDDDDVSVRIWPDKGPRSRHHDDDSDQEFRGGQSDDGLHDGVQRADAMTMAWSRPALILAYSLIFLCSFADSLQWQVMSNLMPYVVSEFSAHSLIPTIGIVASVMSGVLKLPIARLIDAWGRPQGLAAMTALTTIGLLLMAMSPNVKAYAAAEVVYQIGTSGFSYVLDIIIADTSSLRNRAMAFAFNQSPAIIINFVGPVVAIWFYENSNWRWAFTVCAIIYTVFCIPVLSILTINTRKARAAGFLSAQSDNQGGSRSVRQFMVDHDVVGILLVSAGLTLILVPFSLVGLNDGTDGEGGGAEAGDTPTSAGLFGLNALLILAGVILVIWFAIHERRCQHPLIRFSLLLSPNVAGACMLYLSVFVAYFSWDGYYTSYLQVVHDLTIVEAGYVGHIYGVGFPIWSAVVGYLIRRTDRFKWMLWTALPVALAGGALMVVFRRPDTHMIWVVLCQVLITIGGSTLVIGGQTAVMAVASHAELASVMAILSLASYMGSAMGSSLSGAIWNTTLPQALGELLPDGFSASDIARIGSDLEEQLSYKMGDPVRVAIIQAYDKAQIRMCVAGTLVACLAIPAVAIIKDARVSKSRQVKGTVF